MNKKIIGAIIVALLAIVGFSVYTVIQNNKVEGEQTALANDMQADREVEATPVANQKNDNGEYVNGEPDVAIQVSDFFIKCVQCTFNIADTSNIPKEVTDFQKENFSREYFDLTKKFYEGYKSIQLVDCKIQKIYKTTVTALDGTKKSGYGIQYTESIKTQDGKIETAEEDREHATAIVSLENDKMMLESFDAQTK